MPQFKLVIKTERQTEFSPFLTNKNIFSFKGVIMINSDFFYSDLMVFFVNMLFFFLLKLKIKDSNNIKKCLFDVYYITEK